MFYVHVYGPDDLHPFEDELSALREANKLNAMFVKQMEQNAKDPNWPVCYAADMRAIKMWQEKTGKADTWPDHADLVCFLLEQLEKRPASPPDGFVMVPVEPTGAMIDAAASHEFQQCSGNASYVGIYKAMIAAAQKGGA